MAATKVVVDPITRIEGHLRIEVQAEGGRITNSWASATQFRGLERILKGRDPRDAWAFSQRICGVCTVVHAVASLRAVEDALDIRIPPNANTIRNLMVGMQFIHDHVIHFYHLHALDWVDVTSALKADPAAAAKIAQGLSPWPNNSESNFRAVLERLKTFVSGGQLGIFTNGYWGHPAYKLPPEVNLIAVAHYLEALDWQRDIIRLHAIFGGKNPHPNFVVGGMASAINIEDTQTINAERLTDVKQMIDRAQRFIDQVYWPDIVAIAGFYKEWASIGGGAKNYLCYGEFPSTDIRDLSSLYFPRGIVMNRDLSKVVPFDHMGVAEQVTSSWYQYPAGAEAGLHPWDGDTTPNYTGPKAPYEYLQEEKKYSWMKSPRYNGAVMEVGPLARCLVAYAAGHQEVKAQVDELLGKLQVGPEALFSTLGRTGARAVETVLLGRLMQTWYNQLVDRIKGGDVATFNGDKWDPSKWPAEAKGFGYMDAPRGALGHWVRVKDGKLENFQAVVPSTWNCSPRDAQGQMGPYELSLVDNHPLIDPERPLEILRTVHSFDPCLACGVHVLDATGRTITEVKVQ
ncbi:MAG: nickel-dependent hydrogenase large subunit [Gemmatimonadaceae bacterium]|jgi:[NiFe] hydrogenase large subunit/hydrogenase large subunit|nr:nickel-dependent hydrogenase large subunit [Gemmatimonadaceae bacterium]